MGRNRRADFRSPHSLSLILANEAPAAPALAGAIFYWRLATCAPHNLDEGRRSNEVHIAAGIIGR